MDARSRDLSVLTETERSAKTVKVMPSLPASSDVAPLPLHWKQRSCHRQRRSPSQRKSCLIKKNRQTGQVESRAEKNQRIDWEIQQLSNEVPIGLTEDPLMWWKENPLVRNLAARVLAAPPTSVPSEQIFSNTGLVSKKRVALKPAVVDALIFLNKNNM